jgi:hypothetical protein
LANWQWRKRWSTVSSRESRQRTKSKDWSCIFLLLKIFLVLSLSWASNQKKTLCLCWQDDLHNHLKTGWIQFWPIRCLYALEEE